MIRLERGGPLRLGLNYRLAYGWDFVGGPLGLANPERLALVEADFAAFAAHGVQALRWFVLNDGREPLDLASLRAGLDAAERHGLAVLLVLLDHTLCFTRGDRFREFDRLLGEELEPLIVEAGRHPAVFGFELMNEPEMAMKRRDWWWFGRWSGAGVAESQFSFREMASRTKRCRDVVHRQTTKQFSIGPMAARWLDRWEDLIDPARDFLTFHYYGDFDERDLDRVLSAHVAPVAERVAVGLGEFYPNGAAVVPATRASDPWPDIPMRSFFEAARRYRLQLAMPWVWHPGELDPGEIALADFRRDAG